MIAQLYAFAEEQVELSQVQPDGSTLRDHLISAARQTDFPEEIYDPLRCPLELAYLWNVYQTLTMQRPVLGMSSLRGPIPYIEIWSYQRNFQTRFRIFELEIIERLDHMYLEMSAKFEKLKSDKAKAAQAKKDLREH